MKNFRKSLAVLLLLSVIGMTAYPEIFKRVVPFTGTQTEMVYICDSQTAYAYHSSNTCSGLNRCTHTILKVSKTDAVDKYQRRACKICY